MNVLIVGGNGCVGQIIHGLLQKRNPNLNLIIGGRNFKNKEKGLVVIDVTNPKSFKVIAENNINIMLLCTTDKEDNILKYCIDNSVDYIDITKPANELEKAYQYSKRIKVSSKIVFSSGWMSGIIGSLLNWTEPDLENIKEVQIFIYYSLNDASGKSSADFIAENVSKSFKSYRDNKTHLRKYYSRHQWYTYMFGIGKRKTYLFDTPDAFILNKSENIPSIEIRTTYSSKFITWMLYAFQTTGIFRILSLDAKKKMFESNGKGDKTIFELVYKSKNGLKRIGFKNLTGQAELTAFATVLHIEQLLKNEQDAGIYFSHQIHEPATFVGNLLTKKSIEILRHEENISN
jgi:saccharopine dehydrogenase-like NADP-dependent oxidoreductase